MKYTVIFTFFLLVSCLSFSQEKKVGMASEVTTYYFIRHAEKDRSDPSEKNPHLMQKGLERAKKWRLILERIEFDAIYATDYHRTKETAQPLADKNAFSISIYDPNSLDNIDAFLIDTKGKTVLIVGHSNTTPAFINSIIGQKKYEDIDDGNNGNLYIVTIIGDTFVDQLLTIN